MDKNIKEAIDLNGTMSVGYHQGTIVVRVYQTTSQLRYEENVDLKINTNELPFFGGDVDVSIASDIFEIQSERTSIRGFKDYYIKGTFAWLLERALPYLAKTGREFESEVLITNEFNEEEGTFESYASLSDDLPVLLISISISKKSQY